MSKCKVKNTFKGDIKKYTYSERWVSIISHVEGKR